MTQVQLFLVSAPSTKPEFLATIESVNHISHGDTGDIRSDDDDLLARIRSPQLVLEGYTRDAWAWKPHPCWTNVTVKSTDGRNKVPRFIQYLKDRQKSAYAKIKAKSDDSGGGGLLCVTYIQPKTKGDDPNIFHCKIAWDISKIPHCSLVVASNNKATLPSTTASSGSKQSSASKLSAQAAPASKSSGMLGNLLAGQARTYEQYRSSIPVRKASNEAATGNAASSDSAPNAVGKTSQDVLNSFRASLEQKFLDFDISSDNHLQIPISLATQTKSIVGEEEKSKVTMEVLKYIVYEQAEEINEEWVAHKEPGEFMDEIVMSVYKEAPPDVLEDVQRADLPDEMRGQQRALQEASQRRVALNEAKLDAERERNVALSLNQDDEEFAVLNVNKRDRRTIEEIEREMRGTDEPDGTSKKQKMSK